MHIHKNYSYLLTIRMSTFTNLLLNKVRFMEKFIRKTDLFYIKGRKNNQNINLLNTM